MRDNQIGEILAGIVGVALFALYLFGVYKIIADDHRYTIKDVVIGVVIFPYPWWVASKELYHIATISSEDRQFEEKCLDASEAIGLQRNSRLRYCSCLVETRDTKACQAKILIK